MEKILQFYESVFFISRSVGMKWQPKQSDLEGDCRFHRMNEKCLLAGNVVSIRSDP